MRSVVCIVLAAVVYIFSAAQATAKVYWLPDYLKSNADRSNSHFKPDGTPDIKSELECPAGCMTDAKKGSSMVCAYTIPVSGIGNCYCNCVEKDICSGLKKIEECPYDCAQESISPCSGYCEECYTDNCHNREDKLINREWGCQHYYSDCGSKCEIPYEDNCHNRVDNETDWGCDRWWEDCNSKCELGKTCTPNDCTGYKYNSCPDNAICEPCIEGCGNNTEKYKFIACQTGFYDKECFFSQTTADSEPQLCTWSLN